MKRRIKPIKLKIIGVVIIDTFLFCILVSIVYTFWYVPVRAENINHSAGAAEFCSTRTCEPPTATLEPSPTNTLEPSPTNTLEPSPTNTLEPSPTNTLEPSPTNTLEPSPTNTLEPSPTNTLEPSPTYTLEPSPTNTLEPSPTNTLVPSPTNTLIPSPTNTLIPSPTNTLIPSPTRTPRPSPTRTSQPSPTKTNTPAPTNTAQPSPTKTQQPGPSITPNPTGMITPTQTSTGEPPVCSDCYFVKDFKESIISGLYTADLLNTQDITSTLRVEISLYIGYMISEVGSAIHMVDIQPAGEVMRVETPLWCINLSTNPDYWIHTVATAQTTDGSLWLVLDEWVRINPVALKSR